MDKTCSSCFFGTIKDMPSSPCWNCKYDPRAICKGTEDMYVTDSEIFWKDKPVKDKYQIQHPEPCSYPMKPCKCIEAGPAKTNALGTQVAGDHYKGLKIQPVEYIHANQIPFIEGCIIKYISRWRDKGGKADLEKARHFVDLLIELEFKDEK